MEKYIESNPDSYHLHNFENALNQYVNENKYILISTYCEPHEKILNFIFVQNKSLFDSFNESLKKVDPHP
jgi:hypothetical protein